MSKGTAARWSRIESQGKLVYWHLRLPDGSYLAVRRAHFGGGWIWTHRGPRSNRDGTYELHRQGARETVAAAKRDAVDATAFVGSQ